MVSITSQLGCAKIDAGTHPYVGARKSCRAHVFAQAKISKFDEIIGEKDCSVSAKGSLDGREKTHHSLVSNHGATPGIGLCRHLRPPRLVSYRACHFGRYYVRSASDSDVELV